MAANTLVYSESALRVKAAFYNKKAMVYVEGTDDIIFWEQFFDKNVYKVEDVIEYIKGKAGHKIIDKELRRIKRAFGK